MRRRRCSVGSPDLCEYLPLQTLKKAPLWHTSSQPLMTVITLPRSHFCAHLAEGRLCYTNTTMYEKMLTSLAQTHTYQPTNKRIQWPIWLLHCVQNFMHLSLSLLEHLLFLSGILTCVLADIQSRGERERGSTAIKVLETPKP